MNPRIVQNEFAVITIQYTTRTYEQILELGVEKKGKIEVDGIKGVKGVQSDPNGNSFIVVILPRGKNTLMIEGRKDQEKTFDQILSTFRFSH